MSATVPGGQAVLDQVPAPACGHETQPSSGRSPAHGTEVAWALPGFIPLATSLMRMVLAIRIPSFGYTPLVSRALVFNTVFSRVGRTSMRKPLSRPEQDDHGTTQTSIRHHPQLRSAMKEYAVAPIHTSGVAMRHVGPRDATSVPLSILT